MSSDCVVQAYVLHANRLTQLFVLAAYAQVCMQYMKLYCIIINIYKERDYGPFASEIYSNFHQEVKAIVALSAYARVIILEQCLLYLVCNNSIRTNFIYYKIISTYKQYNKRVSISAFCTTNCHIILLCYAFVVVDITTTQVNSVLMMIALALGVCVSLMK